MHLGSKRRWSTERSADAWLDPQSVCSGGCASLPPAVPPPCPPDGAVSIGARQKLLHISSLGQGGLDAAPQLVPALAAEAQHILRRAGWGPAGRVLSNEATGSAGSAAVHSAPTANPKAKFQLHRKRRPGRHCLTLSSDSLACWPGHAASCWQMRRKWAASSSTDSSASPSWPGGPPGPPPAAAAAEEEVGESPGPAPGGGMPPWAIARPSCDARDGRGGWAGWGAAGGSERHP